MLSERCQVYYPIITVFCDCVMMYAPSRKCLTLSSRYMDNCYYCYLHVSNFLSVTMHAGFAVYAFQYWFSVEFHSD